MAEKKEVSAAGSEETKPVKKKAAPKGEAAAKPKKAAAPKKEKAVEEAVEAKVEAPKAKAKEGKAKRAEIVVTLKRSAIGRSKDQKGALVGLGFKRLNQRISVKDTPEIRGMLRKVAHLVEVEQ